MVPELQRISGKKRAGPWAWVIDGARSAVFLRPRWPRAVVRPWALVLLVVAPHALALLVHRLMIDGSARFHWQALGSGWLGVLIAVWLCWLVADSARLPVQVVKPPRGSTLFAILLVLGLVISIPTMTLSLLMMKFGLHESLPYASRVFWGISMLSVVWALLAGAWLLVRQTPKRPVRVVAGLGLLLSAAAAIWTPSSSFWYPDRGDMQGGEEQEPLKLTQQLIEAQSGILHQALDAIQPQRPGKVDLYVITFAPYAPEDVFSREVDMVSEVMRDRFDTGGRQIQLQNHDKTAGTMPWATPLNLQRAIQRAALRMDRDEDILFIHLTSHGARNGQLSADFYPLDVDEVTPQQLKTWLTDAGIRHSVISISACFSGSWIDPLSGPGMLVMTAADADHTSYGCGKKSPLTFFGRALYDEQLRRSTRSFETAHAAARKLIDQREKEAGKTDGYSNPQISVGTQIRGQLAALEARLAALP